MYKVFIENREVNFTDSVSNSDQANSFYFHSNQSLVNDILPLIREFPENKRITIIIKEKEFSLQNVFSEFVFIQAAGGIVEYNEEYLFIKRNGFWDIPKGKLDEGESFEIAAEREISEECGLSKLRRKDIICSTFHTYFFKNKWYLKETRWFHFMISDSQHPICQEEEGITEAKWLNKKDFDFVENETFSSIRFVIMNFEKLLHEKDTLQTAIDLLISNQVLAIPTETVYGLAANALSEKAFSQIFTLKNRPQTNPLIVHCGSIEQVKKYVADFPDWAKKLAEKFWPGPLTLLLPKNELIPNQITAGSDRVGVRIPNHPVTLKLLQNLNFPLAAPSANKYGSISPTCAEHVNIQFGNELPFILDGGPCQVGIESTIIGFEDGKIIVYRLGQITVEEIEEVCDETVFIQNEAGEIIIAPGMVKHHYAPKTILKIIQNHSEIQKDDKSGVILYNEEVIDGIPIENQFIISETGSLLEASQKLYQSFYQLDKLNLDVIFIKLFPNVGIGKSLNDRIQRAGLKE